MTKSEMANFKSQIGVYKVRNEISDRMVNFAAQVIKLLEKIPDKTSAMKLSDQLIRCVTAVGAKGTAKPELVGP